MSLNFKTNYSSREVVESYYVNPRINQGLLKTLGTGIHSYRRLVSKSAKEQELYFYENEALLIGSAVDLLLTSEELLSDYYYVSLVESKPSDNICSILKEVADLADSDNLSDHKLDLIAICNRMGYQPKWGEEAKWRVFEPHAELFKDYYHSKEKIVLSIEDVTTVKSAAFELNGLFQKTLIEGDEVFYQYPVFFTLNGVECKGLIDVLVINNKNKTITPRDFKTTVFPLLNFTLPLKERRYDFQAAFYTKGIQLIAVPSYTVLPFKFDVYSITDKEAATFTCSEELLNNAYNGFESRGKKYIGIEECLERYKWYEQEGYHKDFVTQFQTRELYWDEIQYY